MCYRPCSSRAPCRGKEGEKKKKHVDSSISYLETSSCCNYQQIGPLYIYYATFCVNVVNEYKMFPGSFRRPPPLYSLPYSPKLVCVHITKVHVHKVLISRREYNWRNLYNSLPSLRVLRPIFFPFTSLFCCARLAFLTVYNKTTAVESWYNLYTPRRICR